MAGNKKFKLLEKENLNLLQQITKLKNNCANAQTKIDEFTGAQSINKKALFEEEVERDRHLEENNRLNEQLDDLGKMNEERMKEKELWSNMTMVIEPSGFMHTDFDYTDLTEGSYVYKKAWKAKYLI